MRQVYLDHQSTTPVLPEVLAAMQPFFSEAFGSPSSLHRHGLRARDALARAREQVASLVHAESPEDIIFTSGGTESANLAIQGAAYANQRRGRHVIVSAAEHPAVLGSIEFLEKNGFNCTRVRVNADGWVDPDDVRAAVTDKTILIALHHANHDLGTIQPVRAVADIAGERGIPLFVDATTSAGWLPVDVQAMGAGLLSLAPHRFCGPKGVGVLCRHKRARLNSIIHGGVQEGGRRAGTENVPGIVGAGMAAEMASRELPQRAAHTAALQQKLWEGLRQSIEHIRLNGPEPGPKRISTNLNVSAEFVEGEGVTLLCDMQGIAITSGTSCISKSLKISHVLAAIGLDHALAQSAVILSLGRDNSVEDVDYVIETFPGIVARLRALSPMWDEFQRRRAAPAMSPHR